MKTFGWVSTGVLSVLLGASAVAFAQDKPEDVKPPQQEEPKKEEAKPRKDEAKPETRQEQESREQDKREQDKSARQEHPERPGANARPAGKSERIPDDKFRQHFGREHTVVINRPAIVEGRPRFQANGYSFEIVDPWPVGWAYSDQVYVDYIDGEYFLFDVLHPGVRVALFVTL